MLFKDNEDEGQSQIEGERERNRERERERDRQREREHIDIVYKCLHCWDEIVVFFRGIYVLNV